MSDTARLRRTAHAVPDWLEHSVAICYVEPNRSRCGGARFSRWRTYRRRDWRWLRPLAKRYLKTFSPEKLRPREREVVAFLLGDSGFRDALARHPVAIEHWLTGFQQMHPVEAAIGWNIPVIESVGALQNWLGLETSEIEWFADLKGLIHTQPNHRIQHYHYKALMKRSGDIRLIEAPKERLKGLQRRILTEILDRIPVHPAAHGFRRGRSIQTFTEVHVGQRVLLRMDIQDFFPSFSRARVQAFFRMAGYPEAVADLLGGMCTNIVPAGIWKRYYFDADTGHLREAQSLYAKPHLPQGAPTSPAIANLCAYRIDCRLHGLAKASGATYTRYADDLAFSGGDDFLKRVDGFPRYVAAILLEEGFHAHHRKTRVMRRGTRQYLTGLVVNERVNIVRRDFDQLKAVLTNCVRFGPEGQNREMHPAFRAHLEGRVAFAEMIHAAKGARLRRIFEEIVWPE